MIRLVLVKSGRDASNCWQSLLVGQYECDPLVFNEMEKKLTLERFQREVSAGINTSTLKVKNTWIESLLLLLLLFFLLFVLESWI